MSLDKHISFLAELESIINDRKKNLPEGSYTAELLTQGVDRILRKIGEEASEVIIAGKNADVEEIKAETADLLYHLLVFLASQNIPLADVVDLLRQRHQ